MYQILNWCGKMGAGGKVLEGQAKGGNGDIVDRSRCPGVRPPYALNELGYVITSSCKGKSVNMCVPT